ncbi:hypothetical protein HHI36_021809 [Cryptolaemus montrouzieri]|uniref:Uncharacterized protein n=1 Tax=Cryptolaemus montrouzieri TaxID=559131 RepID=A0ABD2MY68_9CUCU
MFLYNVLIFFLYITFVSSNLEKKMHVKCLSENKISAREVRESDYADVNNLSDPLLHYIRCTEMNEHYFDGSNRIVMSKYKEKLDADNEKVLNCLNNLPEINTIKDIRMFLRCFKRD